MKTFSIKKPPKIRLTPRTQRRHQPNLKKKPDFSQKRPIFT
jgi:hypothetical protein